MSRKILATSLVLIAGGLLLVLYQDPQFGLVFGSTGSNVPSTFRFASSSAATTIVTYNARAIIESLIGAGLVGIGLVLVVVEMLSSPFQRVGP